MFGLVETVGMGIGNIIKELGLRKPSLAEQRQRLAAQQVLAEAIQSNARAVVAVPDSPTTFVSGVAGLDLERGIFFSDPLVPKTGNRRITPKESNVTFTLNFGGTQHTFKARYLGVTKYNKFDALVFVIPNKVTTVQRRLDFRVTPKIVEPVELVIKLKPIETDVAIDISAGGISFHHSAQYKDGSVIPTTLHLPKEDNEVGISLQVVGSRQRDSSATVRETEDIFTIRARFENVRTADDDKIRSYINRRQREIINRVG